MLFLYHQKAAFNFVQSRLRTLKLVLNTEQTKLMVFSNTSELPANVPTVVTQQGKPVELVSHYKYLGFLLDHELSFKTHIAGLVSKLRVKLGFFYRNKSCFSLKARKLLVSATFLDYGDVLHLSAPMKCLQSLNTVYHNALRFVTGDGRLTHHCDLYIRSGLPSLSARRYTHWLTLIYKAILGLVPSYLCSLLRRTTSHYALRSCDVFFYLFVPRVRTELGKKAFSVAAPTAWNSMQAELKFSELLPLGAFRSLLMEKKHETIKQCLCSK